MFERYLRQPRVMHADTSRAAIDLVPETPPKRSLVAAMEVYFGGDGSVLRLLTRLD